MAGLLPQHSVRPPIHLDYRGCKSPSLATGLGGIRTLAPRMGCQCPPRGPKDRSHTFTDVAALQSQPCLAEIEAWLFPRGERESQRRKVACLAFNNKQRREGSLAREVKDGPPGAGVPPASTVDIEPVPWNVLPSSRWHLLRVWI